MMMMGRVKDISRFYELFLENQDVNVWVIKKFGCVIGEGVKTAESLLPNSWKTTAGTRAAGSKDLPIKTTLLDDCNACTDCWLPL